MNKFIKFAGYLLSVAVLFFAIDFAAGYVFDHFLFLKNDAKLKYAFEGGGGEDIVILGASRAAHHYIPSVLEEQLRMTCFNYGMDGRNIYNHYVIASRLLKVLPNKPKIAVLEVAYLDLEDSPGWNEEGMSNLNVLITKDENVKDVMCVLNHPKGVALKYSNLYRYNSLILQLLKATFINNEAVINNKGYIPLNSVWTKDAEVLGNNAAPSFLPSKEYYFRKLLTEFQDADVMIIVYNSPDFRYFENHLVWEDKMAEICHEYNVPFINHEHDSLFMSHKEWFNEPFHLNDKGAKVYTSIVAKEIKDYIEKN